MALVNLQTDLTSLSFGHDRPGGGSSNQPYIQTAIPDGSLPPTSPDFLLRNGFLAPVSAAKDASRLTQMFFDIKSPKGLLFTDKENLLSRIAVKTQASEGMSYAMGQINQGVYLPTSTIAQSLVGFTGTHLNLLGIDPTSPMAGVVQSGLFPGAGLVTYEAAIEGSANRLVELYDSKIQNIKRSYPNYITPNDNINILSYSGGPNSIVGIGKTRIKFASGKRTGINNPQINNETILFDGFGSLLARFTPVTAPTPGGYEKSIDDFRKPLLEGKKSSTIMGFAPSYKQKDNKIIDGRNGSRINYTSPGQKGNIINYTRGKLLPGQDIPIPVDKINAKPIYQSSNVENGPLVNDLVKFRIAAINNANPSLKDYIHFRAYIDAFSDSYNGSWDTLKYMGRGENFYKYGGFNRTINLGFTVAAQSKEELIPMYRKLNFLASNLAPSYSDKGYMAGSLVKLTLGGWCYELPGFISSMTLDIPQESPWEIGINTEGGGDSNVKELPMIVKVSGFSFTPIENFRPAKQSNKFAGNGLLTSYGDERYIALANGEGLTNNNYDEPQLPTTSPQIGDDLFETTEDIPMVPFP